jgi:GNAT superfamily N-acetyltransferase
MLAARAGLVSALPPDAPDILHSGSARVEGAAARSDLCFRSKAVWGYDPEFMALIARRPRNHRRGYHSRRCVGRDREPTGKLPAGLALAPGDGPGALDLNKLFVEPRHVRSGVGRALPAHAVAEARPSG